MLQRVVSAGWVRAFIFASLLGVVACSVLGSSLDRFTEGGGSGDCPTGQERCGDLCVNLRTSPDHCGACDTACPSVQVCDDGSCADSCSGGRTDCNRSCVDLNSDPQHCGACDAFCNASEICSNGTCAASCDPGLEACAGSCVDTQSSDQHCGACSQPCPIGQKCIAGSCDVSCTTGQTLCDGACVDTQTNQNHCGACGTACPAGQACSSGSCAIVCPGGQTECSGLCFDLLSDTDNCGTCGNVCAPGEVCGNGQCALQCPTGQTNCSGSCVDLQTSSTHCGTCGNACGANEECSGGSCVIACKTLLNQAVADPWGWSWDGLERAAASFDQAKTTCEGIGGRLPTASELYRVSATQSATVGQTIHTNYLWSLVPYDTGVHFRVRLSDAATSTQGDTGSLNYRCVCPPPLPDAYVGNNCFGPVGTACYALEGDGNKYNLDVQDRAPLSQGGAIWECTFHRGRLPNPFRLAEAIKQGIGTGSDQWLHTADQPHYSQDTVVRWSDPTTWVFQYTGGTNAISWGNTTDIRPFRCMGTNFDPGTHPASIADEYVGPLSDYKSEANDIAGVGWAQAHDACFDKGGHLPRAAELAELIQQGLPNGSGNWTWTSDQTGWNGTQFLTSIKRWTGTDLLHQHAHSKDLSWDYRTTSAYPFRCIYYPVDTSYNGPAANECAGGCFAVDLPGPSGAKMWLDSFDRAPPATALGAIDACRALGGHLASERDMTEAARHGLPNGSGAWLSTSDVELGDGASGGLLVGIVRWSGTDSAFTDQYDVYSTWGWPYDSRPYRCMWTNELR